MIDHNFRRFVRTTLTAAAVFAATSAAHASFSFEQASTEVTTSALSMVVRFVEEPVTAVPEPETYAMMLIGLGLICTIIRRR